MTIHPIPVTRKWTFTRVSISMKSDLYLLSGVAYIFRFKYKIFPIKVLKIVYFPKVVNTKYTIIRSNYSINIGSNIIIFT